MPYQRNKQTKKKDKPTEIELKMTGTANDVGNGKNQNPYT